MSLSIVLSFLCLASLSCHEFLHAADARPASVAEAAKAIDLTQLPTFTGADPSADKRISSLTYHVGGDVKAVYEFHRKQLTTQGWKELPQASVTDQYASGSFGRNGFTLSLTVIPSGEAGKVNVSLFNHGNVDLGKLPLPAGTKPLYAGPANAMFVTTTPVAEADKFLKTALEKQGWQPYGDAGDQHFFRQNAVRLSVNVASAPAQAGQTMITYSAEQLSAELPAPADAIGLQYSDSTHQVLFDTDKSEADVIKFYQSALAGAKWKSTLDKTIKIDFHDVMIFRNPAMDLIELHMYPVEGKLRVEATWKSAAQVAEEERLAKAAIDAKKMKKGAPSGSISIVLPASAEEVDASGKKIEFKLATGTARKQITKFQEEMKKGGWKVDDRVMELQDQVGTFMLVNGDQQISVTYVDPGFIPAQVTLMSLGEDLKVDKPK
ncbi:hypothetical protein SH661x_002423 [Planctomicrobium sp. SH661]|uniref:hypothetical protein n=1 Tax=Planctomicrobium sp. SH661 TaxID=3448124 RepID=UPI003F5AE164